MTKIAKKFRMFIAEWLDKKPDYCWAELATWAIGFEPFHYIFHKDNFQLNKDCGYCGKCKT